MEVGQSEGYEGKALILTNAIAFTIGRGVTLPTSLSKTDKSFIVKL
jgi:hypothetical protein